MTPAVDDASAILVDYSKTFCILRAFPPQRMENDMARESCGFRELLCREIVFQQVSQLP